MRRFEGKVALITGGASGIGRATAVRLAGEGAAVAIADINDQAAAEACHRVEDAGGRALCIHADVTVAAACEEMAGAAAERFGRLDVLVTSAGVGAGGSVVEITEDEWDRVVDLDLKAVYLSSKAAIPRMRQAGGGAIVHVASIGGLRGRWGAASFSAAKGGVVNLTRCMALHHAREHIRVNCVCPGVIETPLTRRWLSDPETRARQVAAHPMGRLGRPEEVAAAIAFLAGDDASFITGAILTVDGGHVAAG